MTKKTTVLKLGGSLLTDKSKPFTLRENVLEAIAQEIKECIDLGLIDELVLIHGVGSYGHPPVLKHELHKGFKNSNQLNYLSETQLIVNNFRKKISESFLEVGIPIILMHASSIVYGKAMKIINYSLKPLKGFLSLGMVPLMGGDMMYDEDMGFSVCSGDQLAVVISREIGANRLIFATDVSGIYNMDPKVHTDASLLKELEFNDIENVIERDSESQIVDASGGIKGKLASLMSLKDLIKLGLEVTIISMLKRGTLLDCLKGQDVNATKIVFK